MSAAEREAESRVVKVLSRLIGTPDWDVMLEMLQRRGIQKGLREARIVQGLTQAQLAERMGVTQQRIADLENEPWPNPKVSTLARWAHALGLELTIDATPIVTEEEQA